MPTSETNGRGDDGGGSAWSRVDVGGTFTDVCVLDQASGELEVAKVASTQDPIDGVMAGVEQAGVDLRDGALLAAARRRHERRADPRRRRRAAGRARVAMPWRSARNPTTLDAAKDNGRAGNTYRGAPASASPAITDIAGRSSRTSTRTPRASPARILARREIETVAVCFVNAYANGEHEERMAAILREALPDAATSRPPRACCLSSSSTSASPPPRSTRCSSARHRLRRRVDAGACDGGYDGDLLILHSGGVMTPEAVQHLAVRLAASGTPPARSPPSTPPRCAASRTPSGSTWAGRAPTSRWSTTARCGPPTTARPGRVRHPICSPDRGDDRVRWPAGDDRLRRLAAQRPSRPARRPRPARCRGGDSRPTPTPTCPRPARRASGRRMASIATPLPRRSARAWPSR